MNLDVIISLAFISYYRYSFLGVDCIIFLMGVLVYYQLTYKKIPLVIPEQKKKKYIWVRNTISILLAIQLLFYFIFLIPQKPILIHRNTDVGILGVVFVLMVICRFLTIIMLSSLLVSCWFMIEKKQDRIPLRNWYIVISVFIVYYLYILFYMLFPDWNKALSVYELFYNIRNLYITKDPQKTEKTILYLQSMKCIPIQYYSLYEEEWKRTFKNQVAPILSCSF